MAPRVRAGDYVWVDPDEPAADGRLVAVRVGALRRPVPEARAKPVRDGVDAESTQQAGHRGVVEHPPGGRGEHEPLSVEELRRAVRAPRALGATAAPGARGRNRSIPPRPGLPAPTGRFAPRPSARREPQELETRAWCRARRRSPSRAEAPRRPPRPRVRDRIVQTTVAFTLGSLLAALRLRGIELSYQFVVQCDMYAYGLTSAHTKTHICAPVCA